MDLEIRHLKLVDAIAREGGVTKAANRLHLTQSALSHQLREIEGRLQTPLFLRLHKKMLLTEAGEKLLSSAEKVLRELEQTEENIRKLGTGQQGILRISTQCMTCYHWLPAMLKIFQERYPGVDVQIVVEATPHPIEALLEGKLDLAIVHTKIPDKNLSYSPLFEDELLVVMSPGHRLSSRPYIRAQDFAEEAVIVYAIPVETNLVFRGILIPAGITPKAVYKVMLTEAIIEMVKAEIGLSVLARWAVAPYLKSGQLRAVRLTKHGMRRQWHAVTIKNPAAPAYYLEFAKLLSKSAMRVFTEKRAS